VQGLTPLPRLYFEIQEYALWGLWGLSVILGALSVAVLYFIAIHTNYSFYAIVNDNFLTFVFEYLPYAWLIVFATLLGIAYINFSYTRHGYRYPIKRVVLSSLGLSVVGGLALHVFGAGFYVDRELGKMSVNYDSQEELEMKMWQNAKEGRLVGAFDSRLAGAPNIVRFEDVKGALWLMNTLELDRKDIGELLSRESVKVIGVVGTSSNFMIHACGVFPWILKDAPLISELREERREFINMVKRHREGPPPSQLLTKESLASGDMKDVCAHLEVAKLDLE
jgi:hypothetical protein